MAFNSRVNLFFGRDNLITYHEGPQGGIQEAEEKSGSEVDVCVCVCVCEVRGGVWTMLCNICPVPRIPIGLLEDTLYHLNRGTSMQVW